MKTKRIWTIESARYFDPKLDELLDNGYEPFAVTSEIVDDLGNTNIRIYLKKFEGFEGKD